MLNLFSHFDITLISTAAPVQFLGKQAEMEREFLCKQADINCSNCATMQGAKKQKIQKCRSAEIEISAVTLELQ